MVRSYRASEILRVILRFVLRRNETQTKRMVKFNGTASVPIVTIQSQIIYLTLHIKTKRIEYPFG